jgi:hypothetical protein
VVASDIPAYRETARWVPAERVRFVDPDVGAHELTRVITEAPRLPPANVDDWRLPTWNDTVDGTLAAYSASGLHLTGHGALER